MGMPRAQVNKAHKSRFASKASRHVHRTSNADKGRISKAQKNVTKSARAARIQRNKQVGCHTRDASALLIMCF
ncbi:hypothetical protein Taro_016590 [Colocasia esculenta]|uniref:Uncharacterized protein n=1 Tax=Colocasia esculenta TaxID=4460 RepID=A0A843UNX4_COLES|nr:hypothetical protein [Colocasia esculenta]